MNKEIAGGKHSWMEKSEFRVDYWYSSSSAYLLFSQMTFTQKIRMY